MLDVEQCPTAQQHTCLLGPGGWYATQTVLLDQGYQPYDWFGMSVSQGDDILQQVVTKWGSKYGDNWCAALPDKAPPKGVSWEQMLLDYGKTKYKKKKPPAPTGKGKKTRWGWVVAGVAIVIVGGIVVWKTAKK